MAWSLLYSAAKSARHGSNQIEVSLEQQQDSRNMVKVATSCRDSGSEMVLLHDTAMRSMSFLHQARLRITLLVGLSSQKRNLLGITVLELASHESIKMETPPPAP